MKIGVLKETEKNEARVAMTPESAKSLQKLGYVTLVQRGAGKGASITDAAYREAGAQVVASAQALWEEADIILGVRPPRQAEIAALPEGKTYIGFFHPGQNKALLQSCAEKKLHILAMDMVPRISRAQKMDALSSMANIAGYRAVIEASAQFESFFAGQITAAGRILPARVLVIGAGVAGLAAIGVASSLGAETYAFDVRPEVAEQVESMGARFVYLDFAENEQQAENQGGYAAPSSPEFREKQLARFRELAPEMDIVITTALIPGRPAPKLWLDDMLKAMKPGSVVVDLAAEQGGNCSQTLPGKKKKTKEGVTILGYTDFPSRMARQASALYANNIVHFTGALTPEKDGKARIDKKDDVIRTALVCSGGEITYPPPPLKVQAIGRSAPKKPAPSEATQQNTQKKPAHTRMIILALGLLSLLLLGLVAPQSFMQHVVVFVLACFVGYQVVWKVTHALHTPLMSLTNAISGIIILGALMQIGAGSGVVVFLATLSVLIASINIVGGFWVTKRMLAMFRKS